MTRITVYLETSEEALAEGGYLAHVPELPGCTARGETKEAALAKVREAIREHIARSRANGLRSPAEEAVELDVTETDATTLPTDYRPLTDADLDDVVARARASREAFLRALAEIPAGALDWRSGDDDWAMRWIVAHVASADLWYASRLEREGPAELVWRLGATRDLLLGRLASLADDERAAVTTHGGEPWTPRKVARRMLEHEYEHLAHLREALERYREATDG